MPVRVRRLVLADRPVRPCLCRPRLRPTPAGEVAGGRAAATLRLLVTVRARLLGDDAPPGRRDAVDGGHRRSSGGGGGRERAYGVYSADSEVPAAPKLVLVAAPVHELGLLPREVAESHQHHSRRLLVGLEGSHSFVHAPGEGRLCGHDVAPVLVLWVRPEVAEPPPVLGDALQELSRPMQRGGRILGHAQQLLRHATQRGEWRRVVLRLAPLDDRFGGRLAAPPGWGA